MKSLVNSFVVLCVLFSQSAARGDQFDADAAESLAEAAMARSQTTLVSTTISLANATDPYVFWQLYIDGNSSVTGDDQITAKAMAITGQSYLDDSYDAVSASAASYRVASLYMSAGDTCYMAEDWDGASQNYMNAASQCEDVDAGVIIARMWLFMSDAVVSALRAFLI